MMFKYKLPKEIENFIVKSKLTEISIGCSDSQVVKIELSDNNVCFLKIAKKGLLTQEYNALNWLDGKLSVPKIVKFISDDNCEFLITQAIPGEMVCSNRYLSSPDDAIKIIAESFNNIYKVDISNCPFNVSLAYKLALVEKNVKSNLIMESNIKEETLQKFGNIENILKYLKENKFNEELCFSHGDTSLPNIFADKSHFSGFIDVGECGIADKWFDLAICEKSIKRNFGEKYIPVFYETLGIKPNRMKLDYYLLMMELYL